MLKRSFDSVRYDAVPEAVVIAAARRWAERLRLDRSEVVRVGYFGSYAKGNYVPGSDFDVLIEVADPPAARRFADRADPYRPTGFPVGMSILVYATDELDRLRAEEHPFLRTIEADMKTLA